MRAFFLSFFVLAAFFAATSQRTYAQPASSSEAAIRKLEDDNNRARLAGDAARLKELYADDFAGVNAAGGDTGKSQIVRFYSEDGSVLRQHTTSDVRVRMMKDAAIVTAKLEYQYNDRMEDRSVRHMRYTRVYERRATGWLIIAEHFTFDGSAEK